MPQIFKVETYDNVSHEDIPQLFNLLQQYKNSIGEPKLNDAQLEKLKLAITQNKMEFFIAKCGEKLVAMCSIGIVFSTFTCDNIGIFEDFFIVEEYRGKGVARRLTQYVFDEMKARGVVAVWVGRADVDTQMYESLGFDVRLGNLQAWSLQG